MEINFNKELYTNQKINLKKKLYLKHEINFNDELYPKQLKNIKNPPKKIYALGNIKLLQEKSIAIIGSRGCTQYGKQMAIKFAKELRKWNITIVSGMALGVDSYAHLGTLEANGNTIAVLPCGLNKIYPQENEELFTRILELGGLVITEYGENVEANSKKFLERNRIVSGLAIGTLVIEGAYRSGTSVTAKITKENNKPVFCVPSSLENNKGYTPNKLIQEGNYLVMCGEDIVDKFPQFDFKKRKNIRSKKIKIESLEKKKKENKESKKNKENKRNNTTEKISESLSKEVNKEYIDVYKLVTYEPIHINDIVRKSPLDINEINYKLMMLELEGNILALPGKYFKRG